MTRNQEILDATFVMVRDQGRDFNGSRSVNRRQGRGPAQMLKAAVKITRRARGVQLYWRISSFGLVPFWDCCFEPQASVERERWNK